MTDARHREALDQLRALSAGPRASLDALDAALAIICQAIEVPMGKILQLVEQGTLLLVRSGIGWKQGVAGHATVSANTGSVAGYALARPGVVIIDDVKRTSRFTDAELLRSHDVQSSLATRIVCWGQPWGVLTLHEQRRRTFSSTEIAFFKGAAAEIGALIAAS